MKDRVMCHFYQEELIIETNIIGYKTQGEAILLFVYVDGIVEFSLLVDCFRLGTTNKVVEILKAKKISKLSMICWSHPDYDHSLGILSILKDYADKDTQIWIPEGVDKNSKGCCKEAKTLFEFLMKCYSGRSDRFFVGSVSDEKNLMCNIPTRFVNLHDNSRQYPLSIMSYSPNSSRLRREYYHNQSVNNNKSIFLIVGLGKIRIFLTGDIENKTINYIQSEDVSAPIHILKIPHHGSDSASDFIERISSSCNVACSTVYRVGDQNLPIDIIMERYKNQAEFLYCTGKKNAMEETEKYGVLSVTTNVDSLEYCRECYGNTSIWEID